jgi:hypothetical protein
MKAAHRFLNGGSLSFIYILLPSRSVGFRNERVKLKFFFHVFVGC